jgi:DNA-binding transcriptional regulator YdaS (Cro superfamily)
MTAYFGLDIGSSIKATQSSLMGIKAYTVELLGLSSILLAQWILQTQQL